MTDRDARTLEALRRGPYVDPTTARWGGDSLFAIDARDPARPEVVVWTTPDSAPRVIARFEFTSKPTYEPMPSPDGRWLALATSFTEHPINPEVTVLWLLARDVTEPVSPLTMLARLHDQASARTVRWLDAEALVLRGGTFALESRDEHAAWLVYDAHRDSWLDIVCEDAPPATVPTDPDRSVLASAHAAPVDRARDVVTAARESPIAEEASRILHQRIASQIFWKAFGASPDVAIGGFREAISMAPLWWMPRRELCRVLRDMEDWPALREAAEDWRRAQPLHGDAPFNVAIALARARENDAACDALRSALELDGGLLYDAETEPAFDALRGREDFDALIRTDE